MIEFVIYFMLGTFLLGTDTGHEIIKAVFELIITIIYFSFIFIFLYIPVIIYGIYINFKEMIIFLIKIFKKKKKNEIYE